MCSRNAREGRRQRGSDGTENQLHTLVQATCSPKRDCEAHGESRNGKHLCAPLWQLWAMAAPKGAVIRTNQASDIWALDAVAHVDARPPLR